MSQVLEPPVNDLWTVPGEEHLLEEWRKQDERFFAGIDPTVYYHRLQIRDFLEAVAQGREPPVSGEEGRRTVELFTAIYRSQRDGGRVAFPLAEETERTDLDGRLGHPRIIPRPPAAACRPAPPRRP
jgi:hypothetical protein